MSSISGAVKHMRNVLRHLLIGHLSFEHAELERKIDKNRFLLGSLFAKDFRDKKIHNFSDVEFQVYSQFREDGIIQYLVQNVPITNTTCVEIGCGNFAESNTRFLIEHNNWKGLAIDMLPNHVKFLESDAGKYAKYAYAINPVVAYIDPANVNSVLKNAGITGDIGLLSLDIDGVDYWVLKNLTVVSPRIIVLEYNSVFGSKEAVTVPYRKEFDRLQAHSSGLYFGASLKAYVELLKKRNYIFVGSNSTGNNAFFVRKDVASKLHAVSVEKGYVQSRFHDSMDSQGNLTYTVEHKDRLKLIADMKLLNLKSGKHIKCVSLI